VSDWSTPVSSDTVPGVEGAGSGPITPCWSRRCDFGEPDLVQLHFLAALSAIPRGRSAPVAATPPRIQPRRQGGRVVVGRRRAASATWPVFFFFFFFRRLEECHELGPASARLADQDLVERVRRRGTTCIWIAADRPNLGTSGRRPSSASATNRRIVPERGRIGLELHVVPGLVVEPPARALSVASGSGTVFFVVFSARPCRRRSSSARAASERRQASGRPSRSPRGGMVGDGA